MKPIEGASASGPTSTVAPSVAAMSTGVVSARVTTYRHGRVDQSQDWLIDEVPVALVFNGISHAVMLASPTDLEDFARGFALSEGLLENPSELFGIDIEPVCNGVEVRLEVAAGCEFRLKERRRNLSGRTGCGLCGTESLDQVIRPVAQVARTLSISKAAVAHALKTINTAQPLQRISGAAHAAAWCSPDGKVLLAREDVGRHNALDKLIGAMTVAGIDPTKGFVAITSRASVEMVQKAATMGVGILVAVSAPTALAVKLAQDVGVALAGFARGDDFVCYHGPERFGLVTSSPLAA